MSAHLKQWLLTGSTVAGKLRTKSFEKLAKGESLSTTEQAMVNGSFKGGAKIGEQRSIAFAKFDQGLLLTLKEQMLVVASYKGGAVIGAKKEAGAIRGKQISEALQDSKMK